MVYKKKKKKKKKKKYFLIPLRKFNSCHLVSVFLCHFPEHHMLWLQRVRTTQTNCQSILLQPILLFSCQATTSQGCSS